MNRHVMKPTGRFDRTEHMVGALLLQPTPYGDRTNWLLISFIQHHKHTSRTTLCKLPSKDSFFSLFVFILLS